MDELKQFKEQHINSYKNAIIECIKNNTCALFEEDIASLIILMCDSLIILVKGSVVLEGKLAKIKSDYRRKNIKVIADLDEEEIKKTKGVVSLEKNKDEYTIKIEDIKYVSSIFKKLSKCDSVTKFVVEEPTLNEIFIDKVGESYEE